jgi:hypothetical protein
MRHLQSVLEWIQPYIPNFTAVFLSKKVARDVKYVQEFDFKEATLLEKCFSTVLDLVFHEDQRDRFSCRSTESYSIQNFYMVYQIKKGVVWFQKLKTVSLQF